MRATGRAALLAVGVELAVRVVPLDRLASWLGVRLAADAPVGRRDVPAVPPDGERAPAPLDPSERAACRAVARVMRRWPGHAGTCLREALLYGHALRDRDPRLHLCAGSIGDRVLGHAWLSFDGGSLGNRAGMLELTSDGR